MNYTQIPQTDSIQELAEFWDTHDLTDFEDELEEVRELIFDTLVSMRRKPEKLESINTQAKSLEYLLGLNSEVIVEQY